MKPFNLADAIAGKPICMADGSYAKFICHAVDAKETQRVIYLSGGELYAASEDGYGMRGRLHMVTHTRTVYVNLYLHGESRWYDSESRARSHALGEVSAVAIPVEIEE